jgi:hypothetical protein
MTKNKIVLTRKDYDSNVFFNEDGENITLKEWCALSSGKIFNRKHDLNGYLIITKWVGVDMPTHTPVNSSYNRWTPNEPPLIFQTVVFDSDMNSVHLERYSTKYQAYEGHDNLREKYLGMW